MWLVEVGCDWRCDVLLSLVCGVSLLPALGVLCWYELAATSNMCIRNGKPSTSLELKSNIKYRNMNYTLDTYSCSLQRLRNTTSLSTNSLRAWYPSIEQSDFSTALKSGVVRVKERNIDVNVLGRRQCLEYGWVRKRPNPFNTGIYNGIKPKWTWIVKFVALTVSPVIKTQLEALARSAVVTICINWAIVDMTAALRSWTLLKHTHVPAYTWKNHGDIVVLTDCSIRKYLYTPNILAYKLSL